MRNESDAESNDLIDCRKVTPEKKDMYTREGEKPYSENSPDKTFLSKRQKKKFEKKALKLMKQREASKLNPQINPGLNPHYINSVINNENGSAALEGEDLKKRLDEIRSIMRSVVEYKPRCPLCK